MTIGQTHRTYHAPWSRRFVTFYLRGTWAHEVQVGPLVVQLRRRGEAGQRFRRDKPPLHIWTTKYWR